MSLPLVSVPLNPGKNITVICEVVAMNHLLRYGGVDSAQAIQRAADQASCANGARFRQYLEEDYE